MNVSAAKFNKLQNKILAEAKMSLKKTGALSVIIQNDNPDYYQQRALEAIHTAISGQQPHEQRLLAIRLLLLTEIHYAAAEELLPKEGT